MEKFIGTKVIKATPLNLGEYNKYKGWDIPKDEDPKKDGFMVGYSDAEGNFNGDEIAGCHHVSWSPKDVFEAAYAQRDSLTFGIALEVAKWGDKISRKGWNGKDMFVVYQHGYPEGIACNKQTAEAWNINEGDSFKVEPYLQIRTANGSHAMWVPSINDVLSDDWFIVE